MCINDRNKRWFSPLHCLFFILVLVSLLFFNFILKKDLTPEWNPKHWIQNRSSTHFFPSEKLNVSSEQTNGSEAGSSSAPHTSTPEPQVKNQTTVCYKNLTIKTIVMLEWLSEFCSNASYAMKVDSDIFLNVPNMVQLLLKAPRTNYMTGLVVHDTEVYRDPESKWYVPKEILPDSIYPPYPYGLGYMLSLDLTKKLIEASRHVRALYVEDAYLGLCMKHLGILPTDPPDPAAFNAEPTDFSPLCALQGHRHHDRTIQ